MQNINKKKTDEIIRVDHAGEYGAQRIYKGQIDFTNDPRLKKELQKIASEELEHLNYFEKKALKNRVRPTALYPIWNIGGYSLGAITALMGKDYVMACTEAVEEEIVKHYKTQLELLSNSKDKDLKRNISKFLDDEDKHRHYGNQNHSGGLRVRAFKNIISLLTKTAIKVSEKI